MKNYYYRLTITMPETGIIIENDIILDKEVSIYSIPQIAVDKGIITKEDVNNITSVTRIQEKDSKALFYQAEQIVLKPRENYGTGKQFSHLIKDLQVTEDDYTFMIDIGKITKDEVTIAIYPNKFKDIENMAKCTISQIIRILNLNSTKIASVNYILSEMLDNNLVTLADNEKNNTYNDSDLCECDCGECCIDCNDSECDDCNDQCECFKNPNLECCKSCEMTEDCGCYTLKTNRHEFSYTENIDDASKSEPEKTLRIPITPINPKDEIVMLANAIAKRLVMISPTDGEALIVVEKMSDGKFESSLKINTSDNSYYTL